jgi:hypothetical protein
LCCVRQANVDPPTLSWRLIDDRFLDAIRQLESNGTPLSLDSATLDNTASTGQPVKSKDVLAIMNVPGLRRSQVQTRIQRWRRETDTGAARSVRAEQRPSRSSADSQTAISSTSSSGELGAIVLPPILAPSPPTTFALSANRKRSAPDDERVLVQSTTFVERRRQSSSTTTTTTTNHISSATATTSLSTKAMQIPMPMPLDFSPAQRCGLWSEIDELPIEAAAHARLFEPERPDDFDPFSPHDVQ